MTHQDLLQKALNIITGGKLLSSDGYAFVSIDEPTKEQKQLCNALLRGGWRDTEGSLLARESGSTVSGNPDEIEIDGGVLALHQLLGKPFLSQLTALSRLTPQ